MSHQHIVIAIDGGAGTGTSTAAEGVSRALGIPHLNTGSMYRALAWEARRQKIEWSDGEAAAAMAREAKMEFEAGKVVAINGDDVGDALYKDGIGRGASAIGGHQGVRQAMVELQREIAREQGAVMEGRDIGSNVFPDTPYKFYFVCDTNERVRRLRAGGRHDETAETLLARDAADEAHEHGTFTRHVDAIEINTTDISPDQVVATIVATVRDPA